MFIKTQKASVTENFKEIHMPDAEMEGHEIIEAEISVIYIGSKESNRLTTTPEGGNNRGAMLLEP